MDGKHRDVARCYVVKLNWYWKYGKAVVYKLWPKIDSFRIFLADNQRCVPRNRVPGKLGCVRKKVLMMAALMGRLSRCALGQSACFSTQVFVIKCDCGGSAKSTFLCLVLFPKSRFVSRGRQDLVLCFISVTLFSCSMLQPAKHATYTRKASIVFQNGRMEILLLFMNITCIRNEAGTVLKWLGYGEKVEGLEIWLDLIF